MTRGTYVSKKGWYWSVGDRYWKGSGNERTGLGIESSLLKNNSFLEIYVGQKKYSLDCQLAVDFINKYHSYEDLKGVRLGYVPKNLLEVIE